MSTEHTAGSSGPAPTGKACNKCGTFYEDVAANFYIHKRHGLTATCKLCVRAKQRDYAAANRDAVLERGRRYYAENRDALLAAKRRHTRDNPERMRQIKRAEYARNRDKYLHYRRMEREEKPDEVRRRSNDSAKRWALRNPGRARAYQRVASSRRRARLRGSGGRHTVQDVQAQYSRQRGLCYWCKESVGDEYQVDHVIPVSRGGGDGPDNIVIACAPCNHRKSDKMPWEFAGVLL